MSDVGLWAAGIALWVGYAFRWFGWLDLTPEEEATLDEIRAELRGAK